MEKNTARSVYLRLMELHKQEIAKASAGLQAEWFCKLIGEMPISPAYLNNAPVSFWAHKIETGEIMMMR